MIEDTLTFVQYANNKKKETGIDIYDIMFNMIANGKKEVETYGLLEQHIVCIQQEGHSRAAKGLEHIMRGIAGIAGVVDQPPEKDIVYWCKNHDKFEVAEYKGVMDLGDKEPIYLYNTPHGHTFSRQTMLNVKHDNMPDEWWEKYK